MNEELELQKQLIDKLVDFIKSESKSLQSLSVLIGISQPTLREFLKGNPSDKSVKLIEAYLIKRVQELNDLNEEVKKIKQWTYLKDKLRKHQNKDFDYN